MTFMDRLSDLPPGYQLTHHLPFGRSVLRRFLEATYGELFPDQTDFTHLTLALDQYWGTHSRLLWLLNDPEEIPCGCLWVGQGTDLGSGSPYAHIFLLYVVPDHRRQGLGKFLMAQAEQWARQKGFDRLGLQVFTHNHGARQLYQQLGYETYAQVLVKHL